MRASDLEARFFKIDLTYRGTQYRGWQNQPHSPSIEGELLTAMAQLSKGSVESVGGSRTDAGVHACGQCCRISLETALGASGLERAIQALTPADISIRSVTEVTESFHPRFDAIEKRYLYRIDNGDRPSPFGADLTWWCPKPLDLDAMVAAARLIEGTHDFDAFRNASKDPPEDFVRTIHKTSWTRDGDRLSFQATGDGFLYKMVRNIVGTLVEVGLGRRSVDSVTATLQSRDRSEAGATAPPHGLYLMNIRYPGDPELELDPRPILFG